MSSTCPILKELSEATARRNLLLNIATMRAYIADADPRERNNAKPADRNKSIYARACALAERDSSFARFTHRAKFLENSSR